MKKAIFIIILCFLLGVGGVTTGLVISNSPKNVFIKSLSSVVEEVCERDEVEPILNTLDGGSAYVKLARGNFIDSELLLSGKVYFGKEDVLVDDIIVDYKGKSAKGEVYFSDELFYIKEENILGESIGVKRGNFAKDFSNSIFSATADSEYALDGKTYNELYEMTEKYDDLNTDKAKKELNKIIKKYAKKAYGFLCKGAKFSSNNQTVLLNGESVNVRVITLSLDSYDYSEAILNIYDYLRQDNSMRKYLDKFPNGDDIVGFYNELVFDFGLEANELYRDVRENNENWKMDIRLFTPKNEERVLKFAVLYDGVETFSIDFGKQGIKNTNMVTILDDEEVITYQITKDDATAYQSKITIDDETLVDFRIDRSKCVYVLKYQDTRIEGTINEGDEELRITVDKKFVEGDYWSTNIGLEIILKEEDKMPKPEKNITTLDEITEKKMDKWIVDLVYMASWI